MRQITIENVGPIVHLDIPAPEGGGVVVLSGRNGAGKSTALNAAASLMDGETDLSVRDGEERGSVVGAGCEIQVRKRTSRAGTLEVQKIAGEDPALLVDPGLKDPVAADKARLRALCRLARVKSGKALFAPLEELAGVPLPITIVDDLPESAAKTKRAIEQKARDIEEEGKRAGAKVEAILGRTAQVDLSAPHDSAALAAAVEKAVLELASIEGEATACLRATQDAERARAALEAARKENTLPDPSEAHAAVLNARLREAELAEALQAAREARMGAEATFDSTTKVRELMRGWEATIAKAEGMFGATQEQLDGLRGRLALARATEQTGVLVRAALAEKAEADAATLLMQEKRVLADRMRSAAAACDGVVSAAIASVAPRGLKVVDGRLIVTHKRGEIPFEELSHGERWTVALDVAIDAVGEGGLLSIAQEAWEGLDPANRELIATHARKRKALIITAEATPGELRAEVLA